jgi:Leucine-rich repeat (LRR) protein
LDDNVNGMEDVDDYASEMSAAHDQLPTVEEIKAKHFLNSDKHSADYERHKCKRQWMWMAVGMVGVAAFVLLIVASIAKHRHNAAVASVTETVRISKPQVFQDAHSPQSKALHWMTHQDPLKLPLPTQHSDPFVQRYIIAVFIFAVAGDNMTQLRQQFSLLTGTHECLWNAKFQQIDKDGNGMEGTTETLGILCEKEQPAEDKTTPVNGHDNDDPQQPVKVTSIALPSVGLQGELPPELESLTSLQRLTLDNNGIRGQVPVMPYLKHLHLSYNDLTGYMPDHFSEMTRLETLSMSENVLQGSLPMNFAALTKLRILALSGNQLTAGMEQIYSLTNLEEIYLSYNSFEDRLSNGSFHTLPNLKVLDMKSNRLSGPLPDALWNLTKLEVIDFHHNAFDGHINNVIHHNHPLKYLDVSSNILGGGLPPSMSNLRSLTHLDVSYNRFELVLPDYLANLTKMKTLMLTENDMFGPQPLPYWIRGMTDLQHLSFRLTSRTGTLPSWFGELTQLELLDLDWNHVSGTIPTELGQLSSLKYLMLNRNLMNGKIPTQVSLLPNLKMLMVDNNGFSGELEACHITSLIADCGDPEIGCPHCNSDTQRIACPCCTKCCYANAERCNMQDWNVEIEEDFRGIYEKYQHHFGRSKYVPV